MIKSREAHSKKKLMSRLSICRSTDEVILIESYVKENHQGKGGTSYTLTGSDKDGNKHSFSVEKNDEWAGTSREEDGVHVSYYKYTKVVKH